MAAKKTVVRVATPRQEKSEADLVQQAYDDEIKNLVVQLINGYNVPKPTAEKKAAADERFRAGLGLIREARGRALELIQD